MTILQKREREGKKQIGVVMMKFFYVRRRLEALDSITSLSVESNDRLLVDDDDDEDDEVTICDMAVMVVSMFRRRNALTDAVSRSAFSFIIDSIFVYIVAICKIAGQLS